MTLPTLKYHALFKVLLGPIYLLGWLWGWVLSTFYMGEGYARRRAGNIYRLHLIATGQLVLVPQDAVIEAPQDPKQKH